MEAGAATSDAYYKLRRRHLSRREKKEANETDRYFYGLESQMVDAAIEYGREAGLDASEWGELDHRVSQALDVVGSLQFALEDWQTDKPQRWLHRSRLADQVLLYGAEIPINRELAEGTVGEYLALPFRCARFDRLLLDLMIAMEFAAFARECRGAVDVLSKGMLARRAAIFWIAAAVYFAAPFIWSAESAATARAWTVGLFIAWFVLSAAPLLYPSKRRKLLKQMGAVYAAMDSQGPISVPHIEARVNAATEAGVIWPAPLHALLDDLRERDVKRL